MRYNMIINNGKLKGKLIRCESCANLTYKKLSRNEYACAYCGTVYILNDRLLNSVNIRKNTLGGLSIYI